MRRINLLNIVLGAIILGPLIANLPVTFPADVTEIFEQSDWSGNASNATANKTGWTGYSSKGSNVDPGPTGVLLTPMTLNITDTTRADFSASGSTTENLIINDTDSNGTLDAVLKMNATLEDPFTNNQLSRWTNLNEIPEMDSFTAFVKVQGYIYALWGRDIFGRYSTTNKNWEMLENLPVSSGPGAALAYNPNDPNFIYVIPGGGSNAFYRYHIATSPTIDDDYPNGSWKELAPLSATVSEVTTNYYVQFGGCLAAATTVIGGVTYNKVFCLPGYGSYKTLEYIVESNPSLSGTWTLSASDLSAWGQPGLRARLVYPGTGSFLYLNLKGDWSTFLAYNMQMGKWDNFNPPDPAAPISDLCYPGSGKYLYAWHWTTGRRFFRYDTTNSRADSTTAWEELPQIPTYAWRGFLYDPDSNETTPELELLQITRIGQPGLKFNATTKKWNIPLHGQTAPWSGADMVYDGSDTIYQTQGNQVGTLWSYSVSNDTWQTKAGAPFPIFHGANLAYSDGYLYATQGGMGESYLVGNDTYYYGKRFGRYVPGNNTWETLDDAPEYVGWGGALTAVKYVDTVTPANNISPRLYAFRGGRWYYNSVAAAWQTIGTSDFWMYDLDSANATGTYKTWKKVEQSGLGQPAYFNGTATGALDDLTVSGTYNGTAQLKRFRVWINTAGPPNTYSWSEDGITRETSVPIVANTARELYNGSGNSYGVKLTFGSATGHSVNSYWDFTGFTMLPEETYIGANLCYTGGDYLYATRGNNTNQFWKYNIRTGVWTIDTPVPIYMDPNCKAKLRYPGSGDYIYLYPNNQWGYFLRFRFRDANGNPLSKGTWEFLQSSPNSNENGDWPSLITTMEALPLPVTLANGTVENQSKVLVLPNYNYRQPEALVYDISSGKWSGPTHDVYSNRWSGYGSVVCVNDRIKKGSNLVDVKMAYVFSGLGSSHIWKFDVTDNKWVGTVNAGLPNEPFYFRYGTRATYPGSGNYIYVTSGDNVKYLWAYDYVNDLWYKLPDQSFQRFNYGAQLSSGVEPGTGKTVIYAIPGMDPAYYTNIQQLSYRFLKFTVGNPADANIANRGTWEALTDLPVYVNNLYEGGNRLLYVPSDGGVYYKDGRASTGFYKYDISGGGWWTLPVLPVGCYQGSMLWQAPSVNEKYVYLYNGFGRFLRFNVNAQAWEDLSRPPFGSGYPTMGLASLDSSMFYPGGDFIYLFDSYTRNFARFKLPTTAYPLGDWDMPLSYPTQGVDNPPLSMCEGPDGNSLYALGYYIAYFRKYNISARTWTSLQWPATNLGYHFDGYEPQIIYYPDPGLGNYIYGVRGTNGNNFCRYNIDTDQWDGRVSPPSNFGDGYKIVAAPPKIYCLQGGGTTGFWAYDPQANTWQTIAAGTPASVNYGSSLCYPGLGTKIYATRGNRTTDFWCYDISKSTNPWTTLASVPVALGPGYGGTSLVYPGAGDYLYLSQGSTYTIPEGGTSNMFRYSITNNAWERTAVLSPKKFDGHGGKLVYPGTGDYFYSLNGYPHSELSKFLVFKRGTYTSPIKEVGRNQGYGTVTWNCGPTVVKNGTTVEPNTAFEFKARTSNDSLMTGASSWASISDKKNGDDMTSRPYVTDKDKYIQYRMNFYADDMDKLPELRNLALQYFRYPSMATLESSPYDTAALNNRVMNLSWDEVKVTGTDLRFQLKTAPNKAALLASNNWLGPNGTQVFSDTYDDSAYYAFNSSVIEVTGGAAKLKKIYEDFLYTQRILVDNSAGTYAIASYVHTFKIDSTNTDFWAHIASDGSDVRFADEEGNILTYNLSANGGSFDYLNKSASILVRVGAIAKGQKKNIYMKYGYSGGAIASASDPKLVGLPALDALSGWWKFEEGAGNVALDSSGNGNTGRIGGNYSWVSGAIGQQALRFDGSSVSVNVGNGATLPKKLPMTLSMWIKVPVDESGAWRNLISNTAWGGNPGFCTMLHLTTGASVNHFILSLNGADVTYGRVNSGITRNVWHHIAYSVSATQWKLYLDGKALATYTGTFSLGAPSNNVSIGGAFAYSSFLGDIDEVAIFNRNLSDTEVLQLVQGGGSTLPAYFIPMEAEVATTLLPGWSYREEFDIDNINGPRLIDYQVKIPLTKGNEGFWQRCLNTGYDIRFVDLDSNPQKVLDYCRLSFDYVNNTASLWVKIPVLEAGEVKRIYMYYGKSGAVDASNFDAVFTKDFHERGVNTSALSPGGAGAAGATGRASLNITGSVTLESYVNLASLSWIPGFGYRKALTLTNAQGRLLTDTVAEITVPHINGKMNADFSDLRFMDEAGVKLKYKIKAKTDDDSATVLVKLLGSFAAGTQKTVYLYYGNTAAASQSDDTLVSILRPADIPTGYTYWWQFDDGTGTTAKDLGSSSNNVNLYNGPAWTDDAKFGKGALLDGVNDYLRTASYVSFSNDQSISFWFKPASSSFQSGTTSLIQSLPSAAYVGAGQRYLEFSGGVLRYYPAYYSSLWPYVTLQMGGNLSTVKYYHVVVINSLNTVADSYTTKVYVDGSLWGSMTWSNATYPVPAFQYYLFLGYNAYNNTYFLKGSMDEVTFFDHALTSSEVTQLYTAVGGGYDFGADVAAAVESNQSAGLSYTVIGKPGAYELNFTNLGLTGLINGIKIVSTIDYKINELMHAAFTYDGSYAKLYIGGVQKASAPATGPIDINSNALLVGSGLYGVVDEARVWSTAHKQSLIYEYMQRYLSGSEPYLAASLSFNENQGTLASDATSNQNNATLQSGAGWAASPFTYAFGAPNCLYHMDSLLFGTPDSTPDSSGMNNPLYLYNIPRTPVSADLTGFSSGRSFYFDGSAYALANATAALDATDKISIEAWINPQNTSDTGTILVKGDNTQAQPNYNYRLAKVLGNIVFSFYNDGKDYSFTSADSVSENNICHVVVTYDKAAGVVKMYLNGQQTSLTPTSSCTAAMVPNAYKLMVGAEKSPALPQGFKGLIDEIRIYRSVLTAQDVLRHYEHRDSLVNAPVTMPVYAPAVDPEGFVAAYATNNPVVQPVLGVFYDNGNILSFTVTPPDANQPSNTAIKYQVSVDGYNWYWYNANSANLNKWEPVVYGYDNANTASELNSNLASLMTKFPGGDLYYRAFLHVDSGIFSTPELDTATTNLKVGNTYYTDYRGTYLINPEHSNAVDDQWVQYKAYLYSDGEDTPILAQSNLYYLNCYIRIKTPSAAGLELFANSDYDITWDSQGVGDQSKFVKIAYSTDNGANWTQIPNPGNPASFLHQNTGTYTWHVPNLASHQCKVRITSNDYPIVDESDNTFTILSMELASPNGGEILEQGKPWDITWSCSGAVPENLIKLEYTFNTTGVPAWTTIVDPYQNQVPYKYTWTPAAAAGESDTARVKITASNIQYPQFYDISNATFSIVPPPAMAILEPAAVETWNLGTDHAIRWQTNHRQFSNFVKILYSENGTFTGSDVVTVAGNVPIGSTLDNATNANADIFGNYTWVNIPTGTPVSTENKNLKMRVIEQEPVPEARGTQTAAYADFEVKIVEPTLALTAPTSSTYWVKNDVQDIKWTSVGFITPSKLRLEYRVGGDPAANTGWTEIASNQANGANGGSYSWTIPPEAVGGLIDLVYVRVYDQDRPQVKSVSPGFHIMSQPEIKITSPDANSIWIKGVEYQIDWDYYGRRLEPGTPEGSHYRRINIWFSADNGANYTIISFHAPNEPPKAWIPTVETNEARIKVEVDEDDDPNTPNTIVAVSAQFSVGPPEIDVKQPNGGERIYANGDYPIIWSTKGTVTGNFSVSYSLDNGTVWNPIANGTTWSAANCTNCTQYLWSPVDTNADSNRALIMVKDAGRPAVGTQVIDTSNATFTIAPPTVTVTSPNGTPVHEEWTLGTANNVTWTTTGQDYNAIKGLTLQYTNNFSTEAGSTWSNITTFTSNSAEFTNHYYTWNIPGTPIGDYQNCRVRIFDSNRTATTDISDANFRITLPYIEVTQPAGNEWPIGSIQPVAWHTVGSVSNSLSLKYRMGSAGAWNDFVPAVTNIPNNGTTSVTVPTEQTGIAYVKILDNAAPNDIYDISSPFYISNPKIMITAPNGAEKWTEGDIGRITWNNIGAVGSSLTFEYSTDNFSTYDTCIVANIHNTPNTTGNYADWTLPSARTGAKVRIKDNSNVNVFDVSDDSFVILPTPAITLTTPADTGEIWRVGDQRPITWTDNGGKVSPNLKLSYTINGTDANPAWFDIVTLPANATTVPYSYIWTVPDNVAPETSINTCQIKITDMVPVKSVNTVAYSKFFNIRDPLVAITYPAGGETFAFKDIVPVTWNSTGSVSDNLFMQYSPNPGVYSYTGATDPTGDPTSGMNVPNSPKLFQWKVPSTAQASGNTARFKIYDGNREATYDISEGFNIIDVPRFKNLKVFYPGAVPAVPPANGFVLGDVASITWDYDGLTISDDLIIEISSDNFVNPTKTKTVATAVPNTKSYSWTILETMFTGPGLKLRIRDPHAPYATSNPLDATSFRIRGGFIVNFPAAGNYWLANSPQEINWTTRGTITNIGLQLDYINVNPNTGEETPVTQVIPTAGYINNNTFSWTVPNVKTVKPASAKITIWDLDDTTNLVRASSGLFSINYATVQFDVKDFDTRAFLDGLTVKEPANNQVGKPLWEDSGLSSPLGTTRVEKYPYGSYNTYFSKTGWIDNSVTWTPLKQGNAVYTIPVYLENSASAQVTWEAVLTYSYEPTDDTLSAVGSLQRKGKLVGALEGDVAFLKGAKLTIYNPDGLGLPRAVITAATPNATGMYIFPLYENAQFEAGKVYPAKLEIIYNDNPYTTTANIEVGSEKLQKEFYDKTTTNLVTATSDIKTQVATTAATTQDKIVESATDLKGYVSGVLSSTESALKADSEKTRALTETAMKSQILNRETSVRSGQALTIRYRTYSGLNPAIDVYDAINVQRVVKGAMKEIASTGIYEYDVTFQSVWGRGDYTIVCSESTKGTLDAIIISVIKTDIEQISGQVASVLGTTSGIGDLSSIVGTLNSQIGLMQSAITAAAAGFVDKVAGAVSNASVADMIGKQVADIFNKVTKLYGEKDISLPQLFQVTSRQETTLSGLQRNTSRMKAAVKTIEDIVKNKKDEPVTESWLEFP